MKILILLTVLALANPGCTKDLSSTESAEPLESTTMDILSPESFLPLTPEVKPLIALVRCKSSTIESPGTRSQKAVHQVEVVETVVGEADQQVTLSRYFQDQALLEAGKLYVIAAYEEWQDHFDLTGCVEVSESTGPAVLAMAGRQHSERRGSK